MFNPRCFDNSRSDGVAVLEIVPEDGSPKETPRRFVALKKTTVAGETAGPVASLQVRHQFGYSRQDCDRVLEAVYRFPLPSDAAVVGVRVRFGDVEIRASLKERERAEHEYDQARREGRQAALLTRESADVFTLQVAGLQPDQDVLIETDYVQLARPEKVGWSLRIPLTTSPRYVRADEAGSRHAKGQPLGLMRDPGHRFSLDVKIMGGEVHSPTHKLVTSPEDDALRVHLAEGDVVPDRDCVLTWQPRRFADRPALHVHVHDDPADSHVYFLALVSPPRSQLQGAVPREAIVLVDHSGSMQGPKWAAADWAVKKFLATLGQQDTFNLGLFHTSCRWFGKGMKAGTNDNVAEAVGFLDQYKDSGGTELGVALEQALSKPRFNGTAARHVLILTDAEVSDAGRILRLADEESKQAERRRIDVLCIDAAPNAFLAGELAERGGGVSKFLTSNPAEEDIATALDEVLMDWHQPVYANLQLEVNRPHVKAGGRTVLAFDSDSRVDLGDLPAGRSVWVVGRAPRGDGPLKFRILAGSRSIAETTVSQRANLAALKALFGARRVLGLEYLIHSGLGGEEVRDQLTRLGYDTDRDLTGGRKVYAENQRDEINAALKTLLVKEALDYGLASSETAFVAVRSEAGRPVEGTVMVANALPSGWSEDFLGSSGIAYSCLAALPAAMPSAPAQNWGGHDSAARHMSYRLAAGGRIRKEIPRSAKLKAAPLAAPRVAFEAAYGPGLAILFEGTPQLQGGEAVLFDSGGGQDGNSVPEDVTLTSLGLAVPPGSAVDVGLELLLFVDDLAAPRARVTLADLIQQQGERPLNIRRQGGQRLRLVLADANGLWSQNAPSIQVSLGWN